MASSLILFITLILINAQPAYANPNCVRDNLKKLIQNTKTSSSDEVMAAFNEREKLTAKVSKELKPLLQDVQLANSKGAEMDEIQRAYTKFAAIKPRTKAISDRLHDLEMAHAGVNRELIDLNNNFVQKMHVLFKKDGIPSVIVATKDDTPAWRFFPGKDQELGKEILTLKLDFSAAPNSDAAFKYYRRVQKKFGISEVTLSLKDTAERSFLGAFYPGIARLEIGPEGARGLIQEYINSTGKHESRHAMFAAKRKTGDDSIFHTQFQASGDGHLLNEVRYYDTYMSSEELYTFSTDLQSLAQTFKGDSITDEVKRVSLLNQIYNKNEGLITISETQKEVALSMVKSLKKILAQPKEVPPVRFQIHENGNFELNFSDELGRTTTTTFVSENEKKLLKKYQEAQKEFEAGGEAFIRKEMKARGIDPVAFEKKITENNGTPEDFQLINELYGNYVKTGQAQKLKDAMVIATRPVIIAAKVRLEKLHKLATIQNREAHVLQGLVIKTAKDPKHTEAMKKQMFLMAKNVKEDFKGFALKSQKK